MRVNARLPASWPIVEEGPPRIAEVLPGLSLTLSELEPLPANLPAWEDRVVFAGRAPTEVKRGAFRDTQTRLGWPVSIFVSDVQDGSGAFVERRLHALYRFDRHCGVATLRSTRKEMFDAAVDEVVAVLLEAVPDWTTEDPASLDELFRGLPVAAATAGPSSDY